MKQKINICLTCVGGEYIYDIIRAFRLADDMDIKIIGVDNNPEATGRYFLDHFEPVPLPSQVEEYLDADYEISVSGDKATGDALVSRLADALEVAHANEGNEEALTSIHETRRVPSQKVLLRNKHTGQFSKGPQPAGASNGRSGGVPYWEI